MSEFDWLQEAAKAESVDVEDVWNPCTVLKKTRTYVRVRYDGWSEEYDEDIPLNAGKLAKLGTHTIRRRCWVKLDVKHYPAIAYLRSGASERGVQYLETEPFLLFLVSTNKHDKYMFLPPSKALSWHQHSTRKPATVPLQRNAALQFDDEEPLVFRAGTYPKDTRLQFCLTSRTASSAKEEILSLPSEMEDAVHDDEVLALAETLTDAPHPPSQDEVVIVTEPSSSPKLSKRQAVGSSSESLTSKSSNLTPSERIMRLVNKIDESAEELKHPSSTVRDRALVRTATPTSPVIERSEDSIHRFSWEESGSLCNEDVTMRQVASRNLASI